MSWINIDAKAAMFIAKQMNRFRKYNNRERGRGKRGEGRTRAKEGRGRMYGRIKGWKKAGGASKDAVGAWRPLFCGEVSEGQLGGGHAGHAGMKSSLGHDGERCGRQTVCYFAPPLGSDAFALSLVLSPARRF